MFWAGERGRKWIIMIFWVWWVDIRRREGRVVSAIVITINITDADEPT